MNINSPLQINNVITLKNRVVVPPMASGTASQSGTVTAETISHYSSLGLSNASLLMVEYSYVHLTGKSERNQLGIDSDSKILGLKELAQTIHRSGAVSAIQLTHAGAKSSRSQTGGKLISPSGLKVPVKGKELESPDIANRQDINLIKQSFLNAAIRANKAGFQIIELHAAHGYGLNQWISPLTNIRNDQYGGSLFNRSKILLEIIRLIKQNIPEVTLSVRIPGADHFENRLANQDSILLSKTLEKEGVSIINVSSGIGGWRRPQARTGEGYLVDDAEIISRQVEIPVIGVGGIRTARYINESLEQKRFSLAAVGRSILNNPQWGREIGLV
jgi:NADPH2 dehydrogenase